MINAVLAIAKVTFIEQIRNRLYLVILFFGGIILLASLLLGALAPGYKVRVIFDVGLLALELFGLATAVFGAVSLILQEIESKTIYLLLTRPLNRAFYIVGKFLGLLVAVVLTMGVMAIFHILIMLSDLYWFKEFTTGWSFWTTYPTLIFMSICKMMITAAIALFFSLFATSSVSALVFTCFFWLAGHFGPELHFLIQHRAQGPVQFFSRILMWVFPNFQYLNFRDYYSIPHFVGYEMVGGALLYTVGYTCCCLLLSSLLFYRKEF